jgi:hypothetical protein
MRGEAAITYVTADDYGKLLTSSDQRLSQYSAAPDR